MNWQAVIDALRREQVSAANAAMNTFNRMPSPFFDHSKEIERLNLRAELAAMMAGALEAGLAPVAGNGPPCHPNGFWAIAEADITRQSTEHAVCSVCGKPAPLMSTPALCGTGNPEAGDYAGLMEKINGTCR